MNTLKKILAILVIGISILGEAVCVGGIWYSWSINTPITEAITQTLGGVEQILQVADAGLERVSTGLSEAQAAADLVGETAKTVGETLSETSVAYELIARTVGDELFPKVTSARETVTAVSQSIVAFNATLEAANQIPFVDLPTLTDELEVVSNRLTEAQTNVQETRSEIQAIKDEAVGKPVTAITSRTDKVSAGLGEALTAVDNTQQRITTNLERVGTVKAGVPRLIDLISLAVTLVLLWIMLAQGSLMLHSWRYFRGQSPFKGQ